VALLSFPPTPSNGQLYPTSPLPGQSQYRYESATQTWRLEGAATTVTPGCYGDGLNVASFCVDAQGRITSAINTPIASAAQTLQEVTDNGAVTTNVIDVAGIVAAGLTYPAVDGSAGEVLTTDGVGNLSWGNAPASTLQQVTTAGNTTNQPMRFYDAVSTFESVRIEPDSGAVSILPQTGVDPGVYLSPSGINFGNSAGSISAAGLFPASLQFDGSQGTNIKTAQSTFPVQLWAGGLGTVTTPQVSVTGAVTQVNNILRISSAQGIRFYETTGTSFVGLSAPTSLGGSYGLSLPPGNGTTDQVLSTDGAGNLGWLTTAEVVAVPAGSASFGVANQIAFGSGNFYFHDGTQWLQIAGSTF
jgi:hypothetical protein